MTVREAIRSPRRIKTEVLAGLVVALALIPEAISFSVMAGVPPQMGLFSSFIMAMVIAFTGGRPAMISAATGAVAVTIAPIAQNYGIQYFLATVILAGLFQILLALAGVAKLMRFIPRSVMVGFVNSLSIIVFTAQLPHLIGPNIPWLTYPLVALGVAILVLFPRLTTAFPAPLLVITLFTLLVVFTPLSLPDVADQGELPSTLPEFLIPDVPVTVETLRIIGPTALVMAIVGLLESLMTAKLVDDITDTHSNKTRESWGQGVANILSGFFGGMGGCAMIGQTMINVKQSRARTRISTFFAGLFLLILVLALADVAGAIPMAALVAVMLMVAFSSFDWHSVRPSTLRLMPLSETLVMLVTMVTTIVTHNLAISVVAGVLTAMVLFSRRVARMVSVTVDEKSSSDDMRFYRVEGQLFWASSNDLVYQFDYAGDPPRVTLDLSSANIWDASTVAALDAVRAKYAQHEKQVDIVGLDAASSYRLSKLSGHVPNPV